MSKKKISLIQAIIQLIAIVSLFIPISFTRFFTRTDSYKLNTYQYSESLFSATDMSGNLIWSILLVLVSAMALSYFVLYFTTSIEFIRKNYCIAVPCLSLPILLLCVISIENAVSRGSKYSEVYGTNWGFYLICALYVAIVVLELFRRFSKIDEESKSKSIAPTIIQNVSSAEELKKYKELLDSGIISQEEFDAKKNQLLGL